MQSPSIGNAGLDPQRTQALLRGAELERARSTDDGAVAGRKFEAMLGTMLAQEMRKGLEEGFFGTGPGAGTFGAWLDQFVGEAIADRGALGTGRLVENFAQRASDAAGAYTTTQRSVLGGAI